jgi:hypothetical protein
MPRRSTPSSTTCTTAKSDSAAPAPLAIEALLSLSRGSQVLEWPAIADCCLRHNSLEESVRANLQFLKSSPLIRPQLKKHSRGSVFSSETNRLVPVQD